MRTLTHLRIVLLSTLLCSSLLPPAAQAQGTAADYARAEGLKRRLDGLVVGAVEQTAWIGNSARFWYRKTVTGGSTFVVVDAATGTKHPAFDHQRLATALSAATGATYAAAQLPFTSIRFLDHDRAIEVVVDSASDSTTWRCTITAYRCEHVPPRPHTLAREPWHFGGGLYGAPRPLDEQPRPSPDSMWEALIRNYNVYVRPRLRPGAARSRATGGLPTWDPRDTLGIMLSADGSEANAYALASIVWSPDSKRIAAYRVTPGYQREIHYVESSPEDQIQPEYSARLYSKPGDVLDVDRPVLFDVAARREIPVDDALFPNAYDVTPLVWRRDGHAVTFEYNQRGHQVYRVIEIDAATGKTRAVIDERMPTFFEYSAKKFRYDIGDGREIIWMSERDGWNHLYLYDGLTGTVKNQITRGPWVVRGVDTVDTTARQIWFHASGMRAGEDPYFVHYYRINFDGTGLTTLTDADGTHAVTFSPDMRYYVDTWSRVDLPPVTQLRRTSDRKVIAELEHADASALLATGWRPPQPFVAKGRDGTTDIWGVIIRPMCFDSTRTYPVLENIYAGPQGSFVPKAFGLQLGMQAQAELGFIVVQIDGMGTSNRSKAFHDVIWKNLEDAGFPDRILWHRAVAARYPWYDISRVGIYGVSAGGQSALGALLFHPEFYKVAVSAAGAHDNRMDKIWWNEQWMGWPVGPQYRAASNVDNAYRLRGKLLLIVGEMDRNVDPSSTMQVVNALIRAKKTFDLLVIPGADHGWGGDYGERKRWDFFVHNLLGVEPPDRNGAANSAANSAAAPATGVAPPATGDTAVRSPARDSGTVQVPGASLSYVVEGHGRPCMVVGMQVYYRRTFSPRFKQHLRCAYLDLRHFSAGAQERPGQPYGLETSVQDIEATRRTLGLDRFVLVGHSIHGLIALAYAMRYPQHVAGVIAIAAPPAYTPETVKRAQQFWETQASPGRRAALDQAWASMPRDSMKKLSYGDAMVTGYVLTAARYWADSTYDAGWLWKGVTVNGPLAQQIFNPARRHTLPSGGAPSQVPVFVALGRYDYVVPTILWDGAPVPFRNVTVHIFEHAGHTPQLEQPDAFDAQVLAWLGSVHF